MTTPTISLRAAALLTAYVDASYACGAVSTIESREERLPKWNAVFPESERARKEVEQYIAGLESKVAHLQACA